MIKHLVTGGCSFSNGFDINGWTGALSKKFQSINPDITYEHTGRGSSGNDLIQKRVTIALLEELERGTSPEEMLAVVMWSGTSRKAWYIDNEAIVLKMIESWAEFNGGMTNQFVDMKGTLEIPNHRVFHTANGSEFQYNPRGGWYISVNGSDTKLPFVVEHYMLDSEVNGPGKTHESLQNIIMLQNFCRLYNIKLINQFFMQHVYDDIERHKGHEIINYLYKQFDHDNSIKHGIFEFLHPFIGVEEDKATLLEHHSRRAKSDATGLDYFNQDGFHPGEHGYNLWCDTKLYPFLQERNLL